MKIKNTKAKGVLGKSGQILLPALILVPTVLLLVYLIFETTKLSREKIRYQFALDMAVMAEFSSPTGFLNATSYINGAFPFTAFRALLGDEVTKNAVNPKDPDQPSTRPMYDFFYQAGAFPAGVSDDGDNSWVPKESERRWNIKYYEEVRKNWDKVEPEAFDEEEVIDMIDSELTESYDFDADTLALGLQYYPLVYYLLDQIYQDQKKIHESFRYGQWYRRAMFFNLGEETCKESECGQEAVRYFRDMGLNFTEMRIKKMKFYYSHKGAWSGGGITLEGWETDAAKLLEPYEGGDSLFQFAYPDSGTRRRLDNLKKGLDVEQTFDAPPNYFNLDLGALKPRVRVRVMLECPDDKNNCVWPQATPKYQARLLP